MSPDRSRQPLTIVLDTSSSMQDVHDELVGATRHALEWAWNSSLLPVRPQIGVIATGGAASLVVEHGEPLAPVDLDDLGSRGPADIDGTVDLLATEVERVTAANLRSGHRTLRPWVLLVSDGRWGRRDTARALERLQAPPTRPIVHPVGVGRVDDQYVVAKLLLVPLVDTAAAVVQAGVDPRARGDERGRGRGHRCGPRRRPPRPGAHGAPAPRQRARTARLAPAGGLVSNGTVHESGVRCRR